MYNIRFEQFQEARDLRDEDERKRAGYSTMEIAEKILFNSELHQYKIRKNFACRLDAESVECTYADVQRREEEDFRNA
jgi:hypothetical protein